VRRRRVEERDAHLAKSSTPIRRSGGDEVSVIRERLSGVGEAGRALLRDALDAIDAPALC
jgi:hypothetical protein